MRHHHIFSIVVAAAAVAGMTPLAWLVVAAFSWIWMPTWLPYERGLVVFLSMLLAATTVLLASGVPAALWERATGDESGRTTLWIWAATAVAIALALAALSVVPIAR